MGKLPFGHCALLLGPAQVLVLRGGGGGGEVKVAGTLRLEGTPGGETSRALMSACLVLLAI